MAIVFGGLVMSAGVHAAADTDVTTAAGTVATAIKENLVAVLTSNLAVVIIPGLIILGALVIWKFGKRFAK